MTDKPSKNPRVKTSDAHPARHPTLAEELGEVADDLRQLYTDEGLRPYRVFVVVVTWSGGEPDRGEARVESEREFLPTPLLDLRPLRKRNRSGGTVERGQCRLTQVSPTMTEDEIQGLFHVKRGSQVFVEVRHDERDGNAKRRRFWVDGAPWRDAEGFQWVVPLAAQQGARSRSGAPKVTRRRP